MSFFVQPTSAPILKTLSIRTASLVLAGIIVIMVTAQLFSFEAFPDVIRQIWFPTDDVWATVLAAVIVTIEVASLPYLLRMSQSPLARFLSMIAGWLFAIIWVALSLLGISGPCGNAGILGATVTLPGGVWLVLVCAGIVALTAWVSWGMWPLDKTGKK